MENNKLSREEHHRRKPQTKQPEHDIRIYSYLYILRRRTYRHMKLIILRSAS